VFLRSSPCVAAALYYLRSKRENLILPLFWTQTTARGEMFRPQATVAGAAAARVCTGRVYPSWDERKGRT
jgi:hypothetical protein